MSTPLDRRPSSSSTEHHQAPFSGHSSTTEVDHHHEEPKWAKTPEAFAEHEIETYGGDAPFEPVAKHSHAQSITSSKEVSDSRPTTSGGLGQIPHLSSHSPKSLDGASLVDEGEIRNKEAGGAMSLAAPTKAESDPNRVQWEENDAENPQNFPTWRKWFLTALTVMMAMNVTFASSAPSAGLLYISRSFDISLVVANLTTSLMLLGYCVGPIIWSPLSELYGRRWIFIISFAGYVLIQIGDALARNAATLLVCRFIAGCFASACLTVTGGLLVDIWDPITRGTSITLFSASVFLGPVLGPIVGGWLSQSGDNAWRWIFGIIAIWAAVALAIVVFFLPETYSPVLLARRAKKLRAEDPVKNKDLYADHENADFSLKSIVTRTLMRPFHMLFTESILMLTTLYMSVVYGLLYSLFSAFPIIFAEVRGYSPGITGLFFIPVGLGTTIGAIINQYLQRDAAMQLKRWKGFPPPEYRLRGGMLAGPAIVIGAIVLGWSGQYANIHWIVPSIGAVVLGTSFTLTFISFLTYTMEVYLMFASSALAANTILRSATGAAFPLFTDQMYERLTIGGATSLAAGIGLLLCPAPFFFHKYGRSIRMRSKFAPALDANITPDEEIGDAKEKTSQV